jgi:hypothetical protein
MILYRIKYRNLLLIIYVSVEHYNYRKIVLWVCDKEAVMADPTIECRPDPDPT